MALAEILCNDDESQGFIYITKGWLDGAKQYTLTPFDTLTGWSADETLSSQTVLGKLNEYSSNTDTARLVQALNRSVNSTSDFLVSKIAGNSIQADKRGENRTNGMPPNQLYNPFLPLLHTGKSSQQLKGLNSN